MKAQSIAIMFAAVAALGIAPVRADEIKVMISGGMTAPYKALMPKFESLTGHHVSTAYGPSMGTTENAIPVRLARGEAADVLIMVGDALGKLTDQGKVVAASRVDLVRSPIGVAVKAGASKPDISTVERLRQALISAKSVAYSDSASGVYVENELFKRLGLAEAMKGKARMIPAEPVAAVVARGEAELGFQQVSELLPIPGAEVVGKIPSDVQKITVFSAGLLAGAEHAKAGADLIKFLASPEARPALEKAGLEPISGP